MSRVDLSVGDEGYWYDNEEEPKKGGNSTVYMCYKDSDESLKLAVKISKHNMNKKNNKKTKVNIERFDKEIDFHIKSNSKYIVKGIDRGIQDGHPFYIMSYYDHNLEEEMKKEHTPREKIQWVRDICQAVKYCEIRNVWHRDIKPANILVGENNLLLGDFGIAHYEGSSRTNGSEPLANKKYYAPEQVNGSNVDGRADIFAVGLIINEIFTGQIPDGKNYKKISEVCPLYGFLDEIVEGMIEHDVSERISSMEYVLNAIDYHFHYIEEKYDQWSECFEIPSNISDISDLEQNDLENIKQQIFSDSIVANNLLKDKNVDWNTINVCYHENIRYSSKRLIPLAICGMIFSDIRGKFENNCAFECIGKKSVRGYDLDEFVYDKFEEELRSFDLAELYEIVPGQFYSLLINYCLKLYNQLRKTDADSVLSNITRYRGIASDYFCGTPIIDLVHQIDMHIRPLSVIGINLDIDILDYIEVNWCRTTSKYENDKLKRIFNDNEKIVVDKLLDKLKSDYSVSDIHYSENRIYLYFSKDKWGNFINYCDYMTLEGGARECCLRIGEIIEESSIEYGNSICVKLFKSDLTDLLPRLFGIKYECDPSALETHF